MNADEKFRELKKDVLDKFIEKTLHFASHLDIHDPYDYVLPKIRYGMYPLKI
ncbi:MAG: hypothetical protein OEX77_09840 [Candidatus Bathyarchaeota archaeon]|nr:hypothetical protein [Candidatus Bathyarchaeota archaeon]MDH5733170.1 hypothetical protein [Candidatus Bathyarchaeota archaeon]